MEKLENKAQGPFVVLSSDGNTVTIYRPGIPERVNSDRVTHAPRSSPIFKETRARPHTSPELDEDEYVVENILNHYLDQRKASYYHVKRNG